MSAPVDILAIACAEYQAAKAMHEYNKVARVPVGAFEVYLAMKSLERDIATIRGWVAEWRVANGLPVGA